MIDRSGKPFDSYKLLHLLGEGAFGQVYLAEHMRQHTSERVAIKILQLRLEGPELHAFLNEARIIRLRHPHIVSVLDFGVERQQNIPFIVMAYASHGSLHRRHPRGLQVPLPTVVTYVNQIAAALQYAHNADLIHRDLKPENVLLSQDDSMLLSDFGVAIIARSSSTSLQSTKEVSGTPLYMAPEQFMGKPVRASDQYALGIMAYEWLSGTPPFTGTFFELFGQHMQASPPSLRSNAPAISQVVEHVIMKALSKEPGERFASVSEFAAALEQAVQAPLLTTYQSPVQTMPSLTQPAPPSPQPPEGIQAAKQWNKEGDALYALGKYKEATTAYTQAIVLAPSDAEGYYNRGTTYHELEDYQKAVGDCEQAIRLNPNEATYYNQRGLCYDSLGEPEKALADYN
nr:protein kinase [Chloroflexota bacterium]